MPESIDAKRSCLFKTHFYGYTFSQGKDTSNDQSKNRTDHEYQKMIRRVLDEVLPDR